MSRARAAALVPVLAVAGLALTACEQPNPGATAFSGTTSIHQFAPCWAAESATLDETSCPQNLLTEVAGEGADSLPFLAGQTIGISVDPKVADVGWYPVLGGTRLTNEPVTSTYFRFSPTEEQVAAGATTLAVVAGDDEGTRGVWMYRLEPTI